MPIHRHALALATLLLFAPLCASAQERRASVGGGAGIDERQLPLTLEADELQGRPDLDFVAEGKVLLQRGRLTIKSDRLEYDNVADRASARGSVRIEVSDGSWFAGPELSLTLGRFEGWFTNPEYFFARTQAGGRAERIDFIDDQRAQLTRADYTSCTRNGDGVPAWLLSADRVKLDFETNTGIAQGAVLRFLGVPILGAPVLSFPLTDDRKSGWLPPTVNLDSKSGLEVAVPWYWNIAPQRDATLTPIVYTRRGFGALSEARYLEPRHGGELQWHYLPHDRVFDASRSAVKWKQEGFAFGGSANSAWRWRHEGLRVSDDAYWKDFGNALRSFTPRLLPMSAGAEHDWRVAGMDTMTYARVQYWQVLQDADPFALISAPYHRAPQVGWRGLGRPWESGPELSFEAEANRFRLTRDDPGAPPRPDGERFHLLAQASHTWRDAAAWFTPRAALNFAQYRTGTPMSDGRTSASRVIPTVSLDGGLQFERPAQWGARQLTQTLEPRVLYVNTPYRAQETLPLFDTAAKDFNTISVFSDNAFAGVDRVSDAHQVTAGVTTRLIDTASGREALRLGIAQRTLLRDQRITPDGVRLEQRFSDVLLDGSAHLSQKWTFDAAVQYSPELDRVTRSLLSARYQPGPFRTLSMAYRLTRGASEQLDVGWQWPLYTREKDSASAGCGGASHGGGRGTLYGVGRINYSTKDSRITDSLAGFEYDAGCWIGRVVAERVSTGRAEATTRLLLQLELVGLSRLGSNPLSVLKDNIPGYTLLREDRSDPPLRTYTTRSAPAPIDR
jgi:LPS-assembly protein